LEVELYIKNKSNEELKNEAQELFQCIFISECFGTRDLQLYELILEELKGRGYEVKEQKSLIIKK